MEKCRTYKERADSLLQPGWGGDLPSPSMPRTTLGCQTEWKHCHRVPIKQHDGFESAVLTMKDKTWNDFRGEQCKEEVW